MSFAATYAQFVDELKATFPEFAAALTAAGSAPDAQTRFLALWKENAHDVASQNASIFDDAGKDILDGVRMTKKLWSELSSGTHDAIWRYLSTLLLASAAEKAEGIWDLSGFEMDMEEMMKRLKADAESGTGFTSELNGMFEKLMGMAKDFGIGAGAKDVSGAPQFKIPERLFKGHIAKIAEELVKEFKPEDFGIAPEMLESEDPARVFNYLQEVFLKKPDTLIAAAQKIAKKIQAKFQRGEIRREDIIREAEELMEEFSENTAFSSLFSQLSETLKGGEKESGNEGSARRREVQERLRRKAAEKKATRGGAGVTNTVVYGDMTAAAAADAAAEALLREEADAVAASKAAKNKKK